MHSTLHRTDQTPKEAAENWGIDGLANLSPLIRNAVLLAAEAKGGDGSISAKNINTILEDLSAGNLRIEDLISNSRASYRTHETPRQAAENSGIGELANLQQLELNAVLFAAEKKGGIPGEVNTDHVKGKKAILVLSSGGVFTEGPWKAWDFVEPYLRLVLGFIGIEDVQTVRVEGLNIPPLAAGAIPTAEAAVEKLSI